MSHATAWIALITAGVLDIAWAVSMKYADGYTRLGWTLLSLVFLGLFVFLLGRTLQVLPVGSPIRCGPASAPSARSRWVWCCSAKP